MRTGVVLLHGFTQTGESWHSIRSGLAQRYRVVAPDILGHGYASGDRPVTLGAAVREVVDVAPEHFRLAGYSMGARIALSVALAYPRRVDRLVLIGATAGIADPVARRERGLADDLLADRIARMGIEEFADEWGAQPIFATQPRAVAAALREDRLRSTPAGLAEALRGLGQGAFDPVWDRLGELEMPVTLIVGSQDGKYLGLAGEFATRLPGVRLVVVPGAGHAAHLEAPAVAIAEIGG